MSGLQNNEITDKKVVLYIEDDVTNRLMLKKLLEMSDFIVLEAEDGLSGIEIALSRHIDIIILDINMVGMNGYEIATRIKSIEKTKDIPLVAFTANLVQNSRAKAIMSGCDGFIHKPIDTVTFIGKINEYLAGKKETIEADKTHALMKDYNAELVKHLEVEVRELKRLNDDLKELDKMKTDFMSIASHELRTPLVTILGYLEMLESCKIGPLNQMQTKMLGIIARNAARLERIIKDFLTITHLENRTQKIEIEKIDIIKEAENLIEDNDLILKSRHQTCELYCSNNIPPVDCDKEMLMQIMGAILNNAIKYTEDGGELSITINYPSAKISEVTDLDSRKYFDIIISDNGIGIPHDQLTKIFDKFTELTEIKNHHSSDTEFMGCGTGLGLSICKAMIDTFGGYIWAENRQPKGTSIIVVLPTVQNESVLYSKIN